MLDLILANGEVIDGTGRPRFRADVGVSGDRIVAVAAHIDAADVPRIDVRGKVVTPGFIDLHSHSDLVFALPLARQAALLEGRVRQGITTELVGNCGIGCAPITGASRAEVRRVCGFIAPEDVDWEWETMADYLERLSRQGVLVNVGALVAHGAARAAAIGSRAEPPTADGQARIEREIRHAVEAGAFGVSFGLIYPPGQFSDTRELIGAAAAAGAAGGLAAFHQRGSSRPTLLPAVREIVEVGRAARVAVHHSHVETVGPRAWQGSAEVLRLHAEAEESGVAIGGDVIPYTAVCTTFLAIFPPWSLDGGVGALLERLGDPATRRRIRDEVASADPVWPPWEEPGRWTMNIARECGWDHIRLAHVDGPRHAEEVGLTVEAIGRRRGCDPFDALCDLLIEERGVATQLISGISGDESSDRDLLPLLASPRLAFCTDAWDIGKGFPHPGACGAFPRVLGHYVRERRLFGLEEAVRRMTALPAERLGLGDRGRVATGRKADLVVLDPATVADRSTFAAPRRMPSGIDEVIVNGRRVVDSGVYKPAAAGEVLRRAA